MRARAPGDTRSLKGVAGIKPMLAPLPRMLLAALFSWLVTGCAVAPSFGMLQGTVERESVRPFFIPAGGDTEVAVHIYTPRQRAGSRPAVIFLSGCDGGHHLIHRDVARQLHARGVVIAEVQSIEALGNQCSKPLLGGQERTVHAFMAKDLLVRKGLAAPDNVVLVGLSHGGWTVVHAAVEDFPPYAGRYITDARPFAAHVAIYPYCSIYLPRKTVSSPLLILGGSADTWTPVGNCRDVFERSRAPNVTIIEYAGATHAWDAPAPTRTVQGPYGPVVLAHDVEATEDGIRQSMAFIERHLRF